MADELSSPVEQGVGLGDPASGDDDFLRHLPTLPFEVLIVAMPPRVPGVAHAPRPLLFGLPLAALLWLACHLAFHGSPHLIARNVKIVLGGSCLAITAIVVVRRAMSSLFARIRARRARVNESQAIGRLDHRAVAEALLSNRCSHESAVHAIEPQAMRRLRDLHPRCPRVWISRELTSDLSEFEIVDVECARYRVLRPWRQAIAMIVFLVLFGALYTLAAWISSLLHTGANWAGKHLVLHVGVIAAAAIACGLAATMMRPRGSIRLTESSVIVRGMFGRERVYTLHDVVIVLTFAHVIDLLSKDVRQGIGWVLTPEGRVLGFVVP